jgi:hypothetical protein
MISANRIALEKALHPTLTYVHSNGKLDTRASLVDSLVAGTVDYLSIEPLEPRVRVRDDTAVLTTEIRMQVEAAGVVHDLKMSVTAVYFLTEVGWQLAAYQSVRRED